jgi:hypothetical protein
VLESDAPKLSAVSGQPPLCDRPIVQPEMRSVYDGCGSTSDQPAQVTDHRPGGEIGRRSGLKIRIASRRVGVQVPPRAPTDGDFQSA